MRDCTCEWLRVNGQSQRPVGQTPGTVQVEHEWIIYKKAGITKDKFKQMKFAEDPTNKALQDDLSDEWECEFAAQQELGDYATQDLMGSHSALPSPALSMLPICFA